MSPRFGCVAHPLPVTSAARNGERLDMDMTGERRIPAPRQKVWEALNDPAILKASIPGCESLEKTSDHDIQATAAIKIGPIAARFTGKVQLLDLDPPNSYRIAGEGQGGVAGFAKGGATVRLADDGAGHADDLRREGAGRRQDRPARRAADRRHRQADGRPVLQPLRRPGDGRTGNPRRRRRAGRPDRCHRPGAADGRRRPRGGGDRGDAGALARRPPSACSR